MIQRWKTWFIEKIHPLKSLNVLPPCWFSRRLCPGHPPARRPGADPLELLQRKGRRNNSYAVTPWVSDWQTKCYTSYSLPKSYRTPPWERNVYLYVLRSSKKVFEKNVFFPLLYIPKSHLANLHNRLMIGLHSPHFHQSAHEIFHARI